MPLGDRGVVKGENPGHECRGRVWQERESADRSASGAPSEPRPRRGRRSAAGRSRKLRFSISPVHAPTRCRPVRTRGLLTNLRDTDRRPSDFQRACATGSALDHCDVQTAAKSDRPRPEICVAGCVVIVAKPGLLATRRDVLGHFRITGLGGARTHSRPFATTRDSPEPLVVDWPHNPLVPGSSPGGPTLLFATFGGCRERENKE